MGAYTCIVVVGVSREKTLVYVVSHRGGETLMDALAIVCIVFGIGGIVENGPLAYAPSAALRFFNRVFFSTNARCRAFGVVTATVGMALLLPFGDGPLAGFLHAVGWLYVGLGLWCWVLPDNVRRVVSAIYSFLENSIPAPVLRICGVFGVLAGLAFIYVGVYIV
jgi:uncharacterized protein YjeT (DUF2065 family)